MINLIPIEKKKENAINFYYRLVRVAFFVFSFVVFIAAFTLLPAYFLSSVKKNISNQKLEAQKAETIPQLDEHTVSILNSLNSKLDLIEKTKDNQNIISDKVIKEVISRKIHGIKITHIFYQNDPANGKSISVSGVAGSREQLLLFRQSFEDNKLFKEVDLPISNFVKGTDIQFYLNLTLS